LFDFFIAQSSQRKKPPQKPGRFTSSKAGAVQRAKYGGLQVSEAVRLRELEAENGKLKKLLAEAHLDMHALKSVLGVKR